MAKQEHLDKLKEGVEAWNQWRKENPYIDPDLRGAGLSRADLTGADLHGAILIRADLSWAILIRAHLYEAHLIGADLNKSHLYEADLRGAHLRGAHLTGADLIGADLSEAILHGAILHGANLHGAHLNRANLTSATCHLTLFANLDLQTTKGLETIRHDGPSTIGIDTLYRSQGNIPEAFLKGAGIDDTFITYIRSLTNKAIHYYSCFISYSSKDEALKPRQDLLDTYLSYPLD